MTTEQKLHTLLKSVEARLIRLESRLVQFMLQFGVKPKGAIPESQRAKRRKDDAKAS